MNYHIYFAHIKADKVTVLCKSESIIISLYFVGKMENSYRDLLKDLQAHMGFEAKQSL